MQFQGLQNILISGDNIVASTDDTASLEIRELQAIISLPSIALVDFSAPVTKVIQLKLRDKVKNITYPLLKASIYNKGYAYSLNLLYLLSAERNFVLSTSKELIVNVALSGSDSVTAFGQAAILDISSTCC